MRDLPPSNYQSSSLAAAARKPHHAGFRRLSVARFLTALVVYILAMPFMQDLPAGDLVEAALLTIVLAWAVFAVGAGRRALTLGAVLVAPAIAGKWIHHLWPHLMPMAIPLAFGLLFVAFVIVNLLRFVFRAPRVDSEVLCAGVAGYLMIGILWTLAFLLVARLRADAFSFSAAGSSMDGFNALYFSFVNLSTVGFGDIVPVSNVARMLAVVEATVGMFYMAILISRLVALYSSGGPSDREGMLASP